jgi:hypothetical protein
VSVFTGCPAFAGHDVGGSFSQQILVFAGEYEFAVLIVDGRRHHDNAGGALRD